MTSQCTKNHNTSVSCRVIVNTSTRLWALLNNVGRKGNIGCVLPGVDGQGGAVTCIRHPRENLPLCWAMTIGGGLPFCTTRAHRGAFQLARGSTDRFRLLLCRYPHQSSTRPHTRLHTRPTHSPSKEFRLHSLNHLQESSDSKLLIPFRELRLDSRLRAFGPRALRPSRLTPSQVLWFDTTYRALPHPEHLV